MKQKIILLTFLLIGIFSFSVFSQSNPYDGFAPDILKKNKDYIQNFNPGTYDEGILYKCMMEMLNLARSEYAYLYPLKHNEQMDSTAQFQANFQAKKAEKTNENQPPYKYLNFRLQKYGLSQHGAEVVSKAKAYVGIKEYSYYDVCLELLNPLLKNLKTATILLNKEYTYIGFGVACDQNMKSLFASFIFGNDLTLMPFKPSPIDKNLPYTKSKSGISFPTDEICAKCKEQADLEKLVHYFSVKNEEVILNCNDAKTLRKLIGKDGDALVIDFVQHSQYECDNMVVDHNRMNRGFVSKPITYASILDKNEISDSKSNQIKAVVAKIPEEIDPSSHFDLNIIVLKNGKYACRTLLNTYIEAKNADYREKVNFLKDETSIKTAGEWVAVAEETQLEFSLPIVKTKTTYTAADLDTISTIKIPAYKVKKIDIISSNSPNYTNNIAQKKEQTLRATNLAKTLKSMYPGTETNISYDYGWNMFRKLVVDNKDYYYMATDPEEVVIDELNANGGKAAKELDAILSQLRFVKIILHVAYIINNEEDKQKFAVYKFNQAVQKKNIPLAASIHKYFIKQIENNVYTTNSLKQLALLEEKTYQPLWINNLYVESLKIDTIGEKIAYQVKKVYDMNPQNPIAAFNKLVMDVESIPFNSIADITAMQVAYNQLATNPSIAKEYLDKLNWAFQLKIINYLVSQPLTVEGAAQLATAYEQLKLVASQKIDSWKIAYKLASYFIKNYDYLSALQLMTPFLTDPTISEDFLFSYISILSHRPETYLSSLFTKAVSMAAEKNVPRLCGLFDKFPICVFDNQDVMKIVCKACNR
jgi:hypothetical protein